MTISNLSSMNFELCETFGRPYVTGRLNNLLKLECLYCPYAIGLGVIEFVCHELSYSIVEAADK